jgi:hypothetical protein
LVVALQTKGAPERSSLVLSAAESDPAEESVAGLMLNVGFDPPVEARGPETLMVAMRP